MIFVLETYWLPVLLALLIGILTGLWIWRGRDRAARRTMVETEASPIDAAPIAGTAYYKRPEPPRSVDVSPPDATAPPPAAPAGFAEPAPPQTIAAEPTSHRPAESVRPPAGPPAVRRLPGDGEGQGGADAGAAAVEDIADEFLGIDAHPGAPADALTRMKGVGPKLAALLNEAGVTRFDQIGAWSDAELDAMDARMGSFRGRLRRDRVVEQARFLARGDQAGYEAVFGKLGA